MLEYTVYVILFYFIQCCSIVLLLLKLFKLLFKLFQLLVFHFQYYLISLIEIIFNKPRHN